jgi:hypothetical protein
MTDANFRDYGMAGFIGACSGLGAILPLLMGQHVNAYTVVLTGIIASLCTANYLKARFDKREIRK